MSLHGTKCQFAALRRFRLESDRFLPCWQALLQANSLGKITCESQDLIGRH
jgi:hypothetical protein